MTIRPRTRTARTLRSQATEAERVLWRALRTVPLKWKFRRQHPIGGHVADFACPARGLVVEIDGGQHALRGDEDAVRSAALARFGYRVIRFWNNDVLGNLDGVVSVIVAEVERLPTSPRPSPPPRGGEGEEGGEGGEGEDR